jgi:5-methylcytosine-specific restriction endonuclease McrA
MMNVRPFDLWKIAKRQKMKCPISGRMLTTENVSIDHILPLIRGGKNELSNLQLTTKEANQAKHTLTQEELIQLCKDILSMT